VKRWLQRMAFALLGLIILLVIALAGVYGVSDAAIGRNWNDVAAAPLVVNRNTAAVERGRHMGVAITKCVACHMPGLAGGVMIDDGGFGRIFASNLTAGEGGVLGTYTDARLGRAIRNGIAADGRPLLFMPAHEFHPLSDDDVTALIAWIRSLPPADNVLPRSEAGIVARVLYVTGRLPDLLPVERIHHEAVRPAPPLPAGTAEYGRYLAVIGGCIGCHGPGLSGGRIPGTPPDVKPATNLTPTAIGDWSERDFFTAMREGKRPDGSTIDAFMPWQLAGQMNDVEMLALWKYLAAIPAKRTGMR